MATASRPATSPTWAISSQLTSLRWMLRLPTAAPSMSAQATMSASIASRSLSAVPECDWVRAPAICAIPSRILPRRRAPSDGVPAFRSKTGSGGCCGTKAAPETRESIKRFRPRQPCDISCNFRLLQSGPNESVARSVLIADPRFPQRTWCAPVLICAEQLWRVQCVWFGFHRDFFDRRASRPGSFCCVMATFHCSTDTGRI